MSRIKRPTFVYDYTMDQAQMREIVGDCEIDKSAKFRNHQLVFNISTKRNSPVGLANFVGKKKTSVEGVLYNLAQSQLVKLDEFMGAPDKYSRWILEVETDNGIEEVYIYKGRPHKIDKNLRPTREYLDHLLAGRDYLSERYYRELKKTKTIKPKKTKSKK